jgi:hypothetical protein
MRLARTAAALAAAAALLPAGGASAVDPPCVIGDNVYRLATGGEGALCDFRGYLTHPRVTIVWSLACDQVSGSAASGTASCGLASASEEAEWLAVTDPLADRATFRWWADAGTTEAGWFRLDLPAHTTWFTGRFTHVGSTWALESEWAPAEPGHVMLAWAAAGTGQDLPAATGYPLTLSGVMNYGW